MFRSALVPPYVRRAKSMEAALPWLYLHGVSTGDMREALAALVGAGGEGVVGGGGGRLKAPLEPGVPDVAAEPLGKDRWVYRVGRRHLLGLRAEDERLCALVVIGVNERGEKRFPGDRGRGARIEAKLARAAARSEAARADDARRSSPSATGRSASGRRSRKSSRRRAAALLGAQDGERAELPAAIRCKRKPKPRCTNLDGGNQGERRAAFDQFVRHYERNTRRRSSAWSKDREALLAFYEFPAEHWIHIRSRPTSSSPSFATVRHRTDRTKGCLTRDGMLAMIFKLGMSAERSWRRLRGFEWLAKVIRGSEVPRRDRSESWKRASTDQQPSRVAA